MEEALERRRFISTFGRRLRLAFVGGASRSSIGEVHRVASRIDGMFETVAGVFSSDPHRSREIALGEGIDEDRAYATWSDLISKEYQRKDRADVLSVMTPNDSHFDICSAALKAGFDVICDKPLTTSLGSSLRLLSMSRSFDRVLAVTYCYSGYPLVRQARAMVRDGAIGEIRQVHVQYVQGWAVETNLTSWRFNREQVGGSSILIDLGTHAFHLAAFVTGLAARQVIADLDNTVPGRVSDDYGAVLLKYENGACGTIWLTSAAPGSEHGLLFRIFGDKGGLEWVQENPNVLTYMRRGDFAQMITRRKSPLMTAAALQQTRTEIGHPEGYLEAFANIYSDVAWQIASREGVDITDIIEPDFPDARDGVAGLAFVEAAMESAASRTWQTIKVMS